MSKSDEDDCSPSTSGRDEYACSFSSTSPTCDLSQGNDMVSGGGNCNVGIDLTLNDPSSISHCNVSSLDLNTCITNNVIHVSVDSPCISYSSCLTKSHDDMLAMPCCHDKNASISSSCCVSNNVEETNDSMGHDKVLNGASRNSSSPPSLDSHICLMARSSNLSDDEDDGNEEDDIASLNKKGEIVFHTLHKNKIACSNFYEILTIAIESKKLFEYYENKIDKMGAREREYDNEIGALSQDLEVEEETRVSLDEKLKPIEE